MNLDYWLGAPSILAHCCLACVFPFQGIAIHTLPVETEMHQGLLTFLELGYCWDIYLSARKWSSLLIYTQS